MFTRLNQQGVRSDKGFVVQSVSRFVIEYRESAMIIQLSVERAMVNGKAAIYIYPDEFEKWSDGTSIPKDKQKEIFQNFKNAMEFQGVEVLID